MADGDEHPLGQVLDEARKRETDAAARMRDLGRLLEEQKGRLEQLGGYRQEYALQLQAKGEGGSLLPLQLQDYTVFIASLDGHLRTARARLTELQLACEQAREKWLRCHARVKGLETVLEGRRRKQERLQARREQTETDEYASRAARRRRNSEV